MRGWRDYLWITWWRSLWDGPGPRARTQPGVPLTPKQRLLLRLDQDYARQVAGSAAVVRILRRWLDDLDGLLDLSTCDRSAVRNLPQDLADDIVAYVSQRSGHAQLRITLPPGLNQQWGWWSGYGIG